MTCKELIEFIELYVAGDLPPESLLLFDQHLERCPDCVDYLDSYRKTIQYGRDTLLSDAGAQGSPMPEDLVEAILASTFKNPR